MTTGQLGILSMPGAFAQSDCEMPYPEIPNSWNCETGEETGMDIGYRKVGLLESADALKAYDAKQKKQGKRGGS